MRNDKSDPHRLKLFETNCPTLDVQIIFKITIF